MFKKTFINFFFVFLLMPLTPIMAIDLSPYGTLNGHVKHYLTYYHSTLQAISSVDNDHLHRIKGGDPNAFTHQGGANAAMPITHMSEVLNLIHTGVLDECCWRGAPHRYEFDGWASFTTPEILAVRNGYPATAENTSYPIGDSNRTFSVPNDYSETMYSAIHQFRYLSNALIRWN